MDRRNMTIEVISVHVPKAAGRSLRKSLADAYGEAAMHFDYADDPANPCSAWSLDPEGRRLGAKMVELPPAARVVHGHFNPSKYEFLANARRIGFLRHPVDNIISICFYWKGVETDSNYLWKYFRDNRLSLPDLARLPSLRYLYSRTYFGGIDMRAFDFIGFTETYADDLLALSQLLEVPLGESKENVNEQEGYVEAVSASKTDLRVRSALEASLVEDIRFYKEMMRRRHA